MVHEVWIKSCGADLYVRSMGQGEPLLMIHGAGVDSDYFIETAQHLSKCFCVYLYDRRGMGRSSIPQDRDYSIATQVQDVVKVLDCIGRPCLVVAHSAGSSIALETMSSYPTLIQKLLLFEPVICTFSEHSGEVINKLWGISDCIAQQRYARASSEILLLIGGIQEEKFRDKSLEESAQDKQNWNAFIQYEFNAFFSYRPDYVKLPAAKIVLGLSEQNTKTALGEMIYAFSGKVGCTLLRFPGGHNCPINLPREFAYQITGMFFCEDRSG